MDKQTLIKTVIFDLGNVILSFDNRLVSGFIAERSGFSQNVIHSFVIGSELEKSIDRGDICFEDFLDRINEKFLSQISIKDFTAAWCDIFKQNAGIEELIRGLKKNGYRLGMLSNTNRPHFEYVKKKFPVIGLFDDYHLSYETGCLKPEKSAFVGLTEFYSTEPRFLAFIDDIECNVNSARLFGINALRFTSSEKLGAWLSGLGLKF